VLHCTHAELVWECRRQQRCECGSVALASHGVGGDRGAWKMDYERARGAASRCRDRGSARQELGAQWQRMVTQYTRLQLTYGRDTLPALSGCAKEFSGLLGDQYLAGLWRESFAEGLLWMVNKPVDRPRPEKWRAPSWSWASVDTVAGVQYAFALGKATKGRQEFMDRIEAVECVAAGRDSTGAVASGALRVRSRLHPASIRYSCIGCRGALSVTLETTRGPVGKCTFPVSGTKLDIGGVSNINFAADSLYSFRSDFEFISADTDNRCWWVPVWLLHIFGSQSPSSDKFMGNSVSHYFLALKRTSTASGHTFERVALVTISFPNDEIGQVWLHGTFLPGCREEELINIV
jgi:hypothetical protein